MIQDARLKKLDFATLRRDFDASFAVLPQTAEANAEDFLMLGVAQQRYAVRIREVRGVAKARPVTRVPSTTEQLIGIVGLRGALVPVFALAGLLGLEAGAEGASWLLLCGNDEPLALAFHELEGYRHLPASAVSSATADGAGLHVREMLSVAAEVLPIISIPALLLTLQQRRERTRPEERGINAE